MAVQTVTLYDVGASGFITSNVSISPEGVDAQGGTTYSFEELKTVTVTTNAVATVTLSELWAGVSFPSVFSSYSVVPYL